MSIDSPVLWRFAQHAELRRRLPDAQSAWLTVNEQRELADWRNPDRRQQWLMGRLLAKQIVLAQCDSAADDLHMIEICSRDTRGRSVLPRVSVAGQAQPWSLSISHTQTAALVAFCPTLGLRVGVDLVHVVALGPGFLEAWFDAGEQALLPTGNPLEACRLWALKEAVYKAANHDEPFAPRQIGIRRAADGTYACSYRCVDLADRCRIESWTCGNHVAALATVIDDRMPTRHPQADP